MPKTILLVDDDQDLRDMLETLLQDLGHEVHAVLNGQAALDQLRAGLRPDLILTDVTMPVMNGFELLAALQASELLQSIPVVLMSANRSEAPAGLQVSGMLRKPFVRESLVAELDRVFSR